MNSKSKLRIIGLNFFLFALLFGLISLNKDFFRPTLNHILFIKILTGCFPNFIAAFLISLCIVTPVLIRKPKYGKYIVYFGSILVFAILTIEEFKPMWGASTQFDTFDILASGIGSLLSIMTFELIILKRKNKRNT